MNKVTTDQSPEEGKFVPAKPYVPSRDNRTDGLCQRISSSVVTVKRTGVLVVRLTAREMSLRRVDLDVQTDWF